MDKYQLEQESALRIVNYIQNIFKDIERKINLMKGALGKAGFEVKFENDPFVGEFVWCIVSQKNKEGMPVTKTKAMLAEGDYPVKLLGKYLSLARATRIILGDYNA